MKISFCTCCRGRLHQLQQTLPENIKDTKGLNVEFCIFNDNSQDGLDDWMRQYIPEMESGLIRYGYSKENDLFHIPKAKNLSHLLATGDIVVNLDADNFIGKATPIILDYFNNDRRIVLHMSNNVFGDGSYGRIALDRYYFMLLGGYNEQFLACGYHDTDLIHRATFIGLNLMRDARGWRGAIKNSKEDTLKFTGLSDAFVDIDRKNKEISNKNLARRVFTANQSGWGISEFTFNYRQKVSQCCNSGLKML